MLMPPKSVIFAKLFTVLFSQAVWSQYIPTNVTVTTASPQEGSSVTFSCSFIIGNSDVLASVVWKFGHRRTHATWIVDWRVKPDPDTIYYHNNYSAPTYDVSFEDVSSGLSRLTIDPVESKDEGRYWCEPITYGKNGHEYADIEVTPSVPSVHVYIQEGNSIEYDSKVTLYCNYTKLTSDAVATLAFTHGDKFSNSTTMASFFIYADQYSRKNPTYYTPIGPPHYVMRIDGIDSEQDGGWSSLTIFSASGVDNRRYWCTVAFVEHGAILMESVDLTVGEPSNVRVSVSFDEGKTKVLLGSPIKLTCDYIHDAAHTVESIAWALKESEDDYTSIASYISGLKIRYTQANYQPPNYTMTVNESASGSMQGFSELMIQAVDWVDSRGFWCVVTLELGQGQDRDVGVILVTDMISTQPSGITSNAANSLTSRQFEMTTVPLTSELDGFLTTVRVETNEIEINWEPFRSTYDNISQYRVFYQAGTSNIESSVTVDGYQSGIVLMNLLPGTLYRIRVEAYTQEGLLVNLGTIDITTSDVPVETTSTNLFLIVGIPIVVILAAVVIALLIFVIYKRRYPSAAKKRAHNTEYDIPYDEGEYQDLQLVTESKDKPHVYERQLLSLPPLPSSVNFKENNTNGSKSVKEYIEIYPPDRNDFKTSSSGSSSNRQYQELDRTTMDIQSTPGYTEPDSKYQELSKSELAMGNLERTLDKQYQELDRTTMDIQQSTPEYPIPELGSMYQELSKSELTLTNLHRNLEKQYQELDQKRRHQSNVVKDHYKPRTSGAKISSPHHLSERHYHTLDPNSMDKNYTTDIESQGFPDTPKLSTHTADGMSYNTSHPLPTGEYQELDQKTMDKSKTKTNMELSKPNGKKREASNQHRTSSEEYQELNQNTMDKPSSSEYVSLIPETSPEYLELTNPDANELKTTVNETNEDTSPVEERQQPDPNAMGRQSLTEYEVSETMPEYLELINPNDTEYVIPNVSN
ncbi:uncharacterized protein [Amphiura filiformis]|uniref:uncharacterized protein n=1 Tax=Amphiura filiformis TaxID=82378 RepID=UPI003B226F97